LKFLDNAEVIEVSDFSDVDTSWVFVEMLDSSLYQTYKIPTGSQYNPWAYVIFAQWDNSAVPLVKVFPDGRVVFDEVAYAMKYSSFWEHIVLEIFSQNENASIAKIFFKIDAWFLMK
jgi:hypothetical protein